MTIDLGALLATMTPRTLPALPATSVAPTADAADRDAAILSGMAKIRDQAPDSATRDTFFALLAGVTMDLKDVDGMPYQEAQGVFRAAMQRAQARLDSMAGGPAALIADNGAAGPTRAIIGQNGANTPGAPAAAARPVAAPVFARDRLDLGGLAASRLGQWQVARQAGLA